MPRWLALLLIVCAPAAAQNDTSFDYAMSMMVPLAPIGLEGLDRPAIARHYDRDNDRKLIFYKPRPKPGAATPLVIIVRDTVLPGASREIYLDRFMQRLIDGGIAVAIIGIDRPERAGLRGSASAIDRAIQYLRSNPKTFGPLGNTVLIGVGSGSSAVLLAASDVSLWSDVEVRKSIRLIASINGTGFDGPTAVARASEFMSKRYRRIFGETEEAQRLASAIGHMRATIKSPIYFIDQDSPGVINEGEKTAARIRGAGGEAYYESMPWLTGKTKAAVFGDPANKAGSLLIDVIASAVGQPKLSG